LYHEDHSFEECRFTEKRPVLGLVDIHIVAFAPKSLLIDGIGDAIASWFEARSVREANADNFLNGKQAETGFDLAKLCHGVLINDGIKAVQDADVNAITPS
jgi:glycerol dehydrogenase